MIHFVRLINKYLGQRFNKGLLIFFPYWPLSGLLTQRSYEYHIHNFCAIGDKLSAVTFASALWYWWITLVIHQVVFGCICLPFCIEFFIIFVLQRQRLKSMFFLDWTCEHVCEQPIHKTLSNFLSLHVGSTWNSNIFPKLWDFLDWFWCFFFSFFPSPILLEVRMLWERLAMKTEAKRTNSSELG